GGLGRSRARPSMISTMGTLATITPTPSPGGTGPWERCTRLTTRRFGASVGEQRQGPRHPFRDPGSVLMDAHERAVAAVRPRYDIHQTTLRAHLAQGSKRFCGACPADPSDSIQSISLRD